MATAPNITTSPALDEALAQAIAAYRAHNPESEKQYLAAAGAMPGGNTRTVLFYEPFPLCRDLSADVLVGARFTGHERPGGLPS